MKTYLFFVIFMGISSVVQAQKHYVFGRIVNENQRGIEGVLVFNVRTEQTANSNNDGHFIIYAEPKDEIRFIKNGYDRVERKISENSYKEAVTIELLPSVIEIPEISLGFHASGNLKKDAKALERSAKLTALNSELNSSMKIPMKEVIPKLTTPSIAKNSNAIDNAGTVDVVKLISFVSNLIVKNTSTPPTTANYAEKQAFYSRVKAEIDLEYFKQRGVNEYDFEIFLANADEVLNLSKIYRKNFNRYLIESELRSYLEKYLKTHKTAS